jgi:hypothetical protein
VTHTNAHDFVVQTFDRFIVNISKLFILAHSVYHIVHNTMIQKHGVFIAKRKIHHNEFKLD